MVNTGAFNLEQLHEEIEPILNENGVLEASNIELQLDTNKVEIPKIDIASDTVWCPSLGAYVQPGKCP